MATNDFKSFATGSGANVMSQADYLTLSALLTGFQSGKASSAQVNKAIRQATTIAALVGQFIANANVDALDNGDVDALVTKFTTALTSNLGLKTASKRDIGTGTNQIPDMSFWSSPSGGLNMPNGAQIRQGEVSLAGAKTFTTPFANTCFAIAFGVEYGTNNWVFSPGYKSGTLTKTGFEFIHMCYSGVTNPQAAGERVKYVAIGY